MRFSRFSVLPLVCLLLVLLVSCGGDPVYVTPTDADVSFSPAVYYARNGHVRLLYDASADLISSFEGNDLISLYDPDAYSLVVSYTEGTVKRKDAEAHVKELFGSTANLSEKTKSASCGGFSARNVPFSSDDGSSGEVLYGNTNTGYFEIYYVFTQNAPESVREHVKEIVGSVRFAEFTDENDPFTHIYVDPA